MFAKNQHCSKHSTWFNKQMTKKWMNIGGLVLLLPMTADAFGLMGMDHL